MVVGNMPEAADLVIVGGGPGGYTAAAIAARAGRRVLLVEDAGEPGLGGACLHVGCIPSKALIELASHTAAVPHLATMGLNVSGASVDMNAFQNWKGGIVERLAQGVGGMLKQAGVSVRKGRLRFTGPRSAVVNDGQGGAQFIDFKQLILATGSRPASLGALPFDGKRILDSTGVLALTELPATVAIVGGGYIGLELGMALARLGVKTTVVEAGDVLLPSVDASLVGPVKRRLKQLGVDVHLQTFAESADDTHVICRAPNGEMRIEAEKIVVAVGRVPNTDELGLEDARITPDEAGFIKVAADRRITKWLAAIGDITDGPMLAHKAIAEAPVAVAALAGEKVAFEPQCIPAVVFTDPEIATVGLTQRMAKEKGLDVIVHRQPVGASGRAATLMAELGFAQIVTDRRDGTVLGAHLVGPHASELIAEMTLAIELGATLEDVALTIHPHPTLSEQIADMARGGGH